MHFFPSFSFMQTYWMYLRETFWLCLVVMVRMYICSAANRSAASYFSSGPNRSRTTSLQLCSKKKKKEEKHSSYVRILSFWGFVKHISSPQRAIRAPVHPHWAVISCSQPLWPEIPSKGGTAAFSPRRRTQKHRIAELWQKKKRWLTRLLSGCFTSLIIKRILRKKCIISEGSSWYKKKTLFANGFWSWKD